jgi:transposase InsO family protein
MFIESQTKRKLKILRGDNGSEFVSKEFEKFLKFHGIQYQKLASYSPQQNGIVEHVNQTIVEATRNMLQHTGLSPKF